MKKIVVHTIPLLIASSFSVNAEILDYLTQVPDPLSDTNPIYTQQSSGVPPLGTQFTESSFGLGVTRLTNDESVGSRHEYSRFDPYNKDRSMIILNGDGGYSSVYNTQNYPYNAVTNKVTSLYDFSNNVQIRVREARWDRTNTSKIWGLSDASIKTVNLSSNTPVVSVIKDFSTENVLTQKLGSDFTITMNNEGESSYDNRHWAFLAKSNAGSGSFKDKQVIFTWDNDSKQILGTYELSERERGNIDWVGMSPKGNHVLIGSLDYNNPNANQIIGLAMANKDFSNFNTGPDANKKFHRLNYDTAHADVGLDSNGNEVVIMQNTRTDHIDLIPIDPETVSINTVPLSTDPDPYIDSNRTKLVRLNYTSDDGGFDLYSGVHISGNFDGYALISTTAAPGNTEENWLEKVLLLVKLDPDADNPLAGYISKTYNTTGTVPNPPRLDGNFWEETHGTITNDGSKILWAANWDQDGSGPYSDLDNFLLEADLAAVPIPTAFLLFGSSLLGLFGFSRKQKR